MEKTKKGVRLEHISKIYKDPKTGKDFYAVKDTSLEIKPGSFVTLLGPSGCGKTTTLRMIAGFESPDEGEIYLGDEAINELTPNKRDTAMVFQSYALLPHYNIFDNVAYGLKLRKMPKDVIREKVLKILDLVELSGMESRMTNQLSGGQQQRVALARALVIEPSVLLFDEPLSNLDAKLRVQMRTEIRRIQQEVGITAIYVTHDQSEAMAISDNIIIYLDVHFHNISALCVANLANAAALLYNTLPDLNWAGFYLMENGLLVLGPFQGKPACIEIQVGRGVCGTAAAEDRTQLVYDVHQFPGHIACDSASNSEIVVPIHGDGRIVGVLDIDSPSIGRFTEADRAGLEAFVGILEAELW